MKGVAGLSGPKGSYRTSSCAPRPPLERVVAMAALFTEEGRRERLAGQEGNLGFLRIWSRNVSPVERSHPQEAETISALAGESEQPIGTFASNTLCSYPFVKPLMGMGHNHDLISGDESLWRRVGFGRALPVSRWEWHCAPGLVRGLVFLVEDESGDMTVQWLAEGVTA